MIRAAGSFFMVGCWLKVSATMVSWQRKIFKKHWLKRPKVVPKKLFRGIQRFYICPDVPVDISRVFFNFIFSSRKCQSQQKLSKKITRFAIQFRSKNLTHFTNLSPLDNENNMLAQHCQKHFCLYKFSSKHVSVWCPKRYLLCSISWRPGTALLKHFESCIFDVCIFLYISVRKFFVTDT